MVSHKYCADFVFCATVTALSLASDRFSFLVEGVGVVISISTLLIDPTEHMKARKTSSTMCVNDVALWGVCVIVAKKQTNKQKTNKQNKTKKKKKNKTKSKQQKTKKPQTNPNQNSNISCVIFFLGVIVPPSLAHRECRVAFMFYIHQQWMFWWWVGCQFLKKKKSNWKQRNKRKAPRM